MIVFKVSLNGDEVCTAGVREFGVVSANVTWTGRKPEKSRDENSIEEELTADVGGLDSNSGEHLMWLARPLHIGDRVMIEIVESESIDKPKRRYRDDPGTVERAKKRYAERVRQEFGEVITPTASSRPPSRKEPKAPRG